METIQNLWGDVGVMADSEMHCRWVSWTGEDHGFKPATGWLYFKPTRHSFLLDQSYLDGMTIASSLIQKSTLSLSPLEAEEPLIPHLIIYPRSTTFKTR